MGSTVAATAALLATRSTQSRCCMCGGRRHHRIDAARLFGLGAEHALAQVAQLRACQHEIGLKLGHPLAGPGKLAVMA